MSNFSMCDAIKDFMSLLEKGSISIYNESSLQHELGVYLKDRLKSVGSYRVDFERNVLEPPVVSASNNFTAADFEKERMDLFIHYDGKGVGNPEYERYAMELKFPPYKWNEQRRFIEFTKDITFMEQVHDKLDVKTYCLTIGRNEAAYSSCLKYRGQNYKALYDFYRTCNTGNIQKNPSGYILSTKSGPKGNLLYADDTNRKNDYHIVWNPLFDRSGNQIKSLDRYDKGRDNIFFYMIEFN